MKCQYCGLPPRPNDQRCDGCGAPFEILGGNSTAAESGGTAMDVLTGYTVIRPYLEGGHAANRMVNKLAGF